MRRAANVAVAGAALAFGASTAAAWCDQGVLAEQLSSVASLRCVLPDQVGAGPAGWHRWGVEVADTAQDTVSAWLRAHTANARAPVQQAAGSSCRTVHAFLYGPAEASAQPCSALGRQRVYGGATTDDCDPQQRWIQHRGESGNELPLDDELDGLTEESAKPGGHMRPAMFAEKGCTTTMAAEHRHWLRLIRQHLQEAGVRQLPGRFDDADVELMRYAGTAGLLRAPPGGRAAVAAKCARAVQATTEWLAGHTFLTDGELRQWDHLVSWQGRDAGGHPVLVVRIGEAIASCDKERGAQFANAIITQVDRAVASRLAGPGPGADQMVAVMDAEGASSWQVARVMNVVKTIATTLNRHYPGRLHRLYLVDPPRMIAVPLHAVLPLLHQETAQKVQLCGAGSPELPVKLR